MIEGLWTIRFDQPGYDEYNLRGGVVVIESGRILGGDSGYYYVGEVTPRSGGGWELAARVVRHDPTIESLFGDVDEVQTSGILIKGEPDDSGRPTLDAAYVGPNGPLPLKLVKVAELP